MNIHPYLLRQLSKCKKRNKKKILLAKIAVLTKMPSKTFKCRLSENSVHITKNSKKINSYNLYKCSKSFGLVCDWMGSDL